MNKTNCPPRWSLIFVLGVLLWSGCKPDGRSRQSAPEEARNSPQITASPNPVSFRDGKGTTTIAWSTGDDTLAEVYVSIAGGPDQLFAGESSKGSQVADWIHPEGTYEFRLYGLKHTKLLGTVRITPAPAAPTGKSAIQQP